MSNYIDGFVVPVKTARKQEYVEMAAKMAKKYLSWGALNVVESWGDDIQDGKVTDFKRAVGAEADETVVFSWVVWPSKEVREAGNKKLHEDPEILEHMQTVTDPPFNMQRMIYGGFSAIIFERT